MWTQAHVSVVEQFVRVRGVPPLDDEGCRAWTRQVAEQLAWSFSSEGWGHKQASASRPPSTDVVATRAPFVGYDLITEQGRASQQVNYHPGTIPLDGQVFIAVNPTNHLGGTPPGPPLPPVPIPPGPVPPGPTPTVCQFVAPDFGPVGTLLAQVLTAVESDRRDREAQVASLRERMEAMNEEWHRVVSEQVTGLLKAIEGRR